MPDGEGFVAADGSAVDVGAADRIRLWHPIDATETDVAAWRTGLLARQVRQPFAQAFREVYILTRLRPRPSNWFEPVCRPASCATRRPARLMTARRWGSNFLGPYDGGYNGIAKREFKTHAIRAPGVLRHDAIEHEPPGLRRDGRALAAADQVRVACGQGRVDDLMRLADVPPIVFSEAMRDVDLFVSVTSIGATSLARRGAGAP